MHPSMEKGFIPAFQSNLARDLYHIAITQPKEKRPDRHELFVAGRMAFLWDLQDSSSSSDIPTTVIRSKSEVKEDVYKLLFI